MKKRAWTAEEITKTAATLARLKTPILAVLVLSTVVVPKHPEQPMTEEEMALFFIGIGFFGARSCALKEAKRQVRRWRKQAYSQFCSLLVATVDARLATMELAKGRVKGE